MPANIPISAGVPIAIARGAFASITSLDTGDTFVFQIPPSEQERDYEANWEECGVAQASPQLLEYRDSPPERRTVRFSLSAYQYDGLHGSIESRLATLKKLTRRVPGKTHAHRCLFVLGRNRFRCVVKSVSVPIDRVSPEGDALRTVDASVTLQELAPPLR